MTISNPTRRGLLAAIIGAAAAPAIIKTAGLIMPIKPKLVVEPHGIVILESRWSLADLEEMDRRSRADWKHVRDQGMAMLSIRGIDQWGKPVTEELVVGGPPSKTQFRQVFAVTADTGTGGVTVRA